MISITDHLSSRRLSWDAAAEKAGIPAERLRAVAAGANASLAEMRRIAKALSVPLSAIVGSNVAEPIKVLFRQTIGQRAAVASSSIEVISNQIRGGLALASRLPRNLRWLDAFRGVPATLEHAEDLAQRFRSSCAGLDDSDPFPHLAQIVEQLGVIVLMCQDATVEGVSAVVDGYAIVLIGPRTFRPRMLFTLAHEMGHIVAHHDHPDGYAMLDDEQDFDQLIDVPQRVEERFADAFASAVLLPRHGVLRSLRVIRDQLKASGPLGDIEILSLARFFSVSFEVAARRCEQLDLLPARGARALYQRLVDDFGNPERRGDELGLPKRAEIDIGTSPALLRAAAAAVRQGAMSIGRAAELVNVPISVLFAANTEPAE